jgi:hypothetical protein
MGFRYLLGVLGLLSLVVLGGCFDKQTATAGQIGCPASEVAISDEDSTIGWDEAAETWTATCRDRVFICSHIKTSGNNGTTSSSVSCHERLGSEGEQAKGSAPTAPAKHRADPPTGAAGFEFGQSPAESQKACEGADNTWQAPSDEQASCSGPAADIGLEATVALSFCHGRACRIVVSHRPELKWAGALSKLLATLNRKYGEAQDHDGAVPFECHADPAFLDCLDNKRLHLRYTWRWPAGERLDVNVGKIKGGDSAIVLQYMNGKKKDELNDSAL